MFKKIKDNQQGISLLLTILILSSLMILTLTISDVVLRVGRSTENVAVSEVAYFAAETAVEKALFEIEKNYNIENLNVATPQNMSATSATWTRSVLQNNTIDVACATFLSSGNCVSEGMCADEIGQLSASNPLVVCLNAGKSFQIDLKYSGMEWPENLKINWSGSAKIIENNEEMVGGELVVNQTTFTEPESIHDVDSNIRLINTESSGIKKFTLKPAPGNFAIGITVVGTGKYRDTERVLEVEKKVWQIY